MGGKGFGFRDRDRPGLGSDECAGGSSEHTAVMSKLSNSTKMGPGQGRLAAMKAAFKAQYQSQVSYTANFLFTFAIYFWNYVRSEVKDD